MKKNTRFIPAMHFHWLTPLFDWIANTTLPDRELKERLIDQARIESGHRVLDLSCGTATLALLIKQRHPEAGAIGLDIDPEILKIAHNKVLKAGLEIDLHRGTATRLPYPDASFDRVLSSFAIHHLTYQDKQRAAQEIFRILRQGGELHVLDFGKPRTTYCVGISYLLRWVEELMENIKGLLPMIFSNAGFEDVEECCHQATLFGSVSLYRARKRSPS